MKSLCGWSSVPTNSKMEVLTKLSSIWSPPITASEVFTALTALQMMTFKIPPQIQNYCNIDTFDYIVVGAGSAGSIVATRLSEDKDVSVLLVEAGEDPPITSMFPAYYSLLPRTKWDWNFTSTQSPKHKCHKDLIVNMNQGKMLGGTSSFNWVCYVTGDPHDYDGWAYITGDDSWSYDNILPIIKQNEHLFDQEILNSPNGINYGTNGTVGVTRERNTRNSKIVDEYLEAFRELGHEILSDTEGGRSNLGFGHLLHNIADGVRQSTAQSFLKPAMGRPNLWVQKNTLATKILFDCNKNAVGIETINVKGKKQIFKAKREVIVSAGSINTPKLLMLSGIGPQKHLEEMEIPVIADLPVGENLQDHIAVLQPYVTDASLIPNLPLNPHAYPAPILAGYVALDKSQSYPDFQVLGTIIDAALFLLLAEASTTYKDEIIDKFYNQSRGRHVFLLYTTKLTEKSRGRVKLRSINPEDSPIIDLGMYSNEEDLHDAIAYTRDVNRLMDTKFFRSRKAELLKPPCCEDLDSDTEEYWSCHVQCLSASFYHYVGSCAMGSVVDSRLKVYNVKKLRVIDASIMPTITRGNTNVASMMIGQKGADMIKADHRHHHRSRHHFKSTSTRY